MTYRNVTYTTPSHTDLVCIMRHTLQALLTFIFLPISESDYVLYEVTAFNHRERAFLYSLHVKTPTVIFMNGVSNEAAIPMDVVVKMEIAYMFEAWLKSLDIQYIYVSQITLSQIKKKQILPSHQNISNTFYNWEDILNWIMEKKQKNPSLEMIVFAKTYEKRDIFFLKVNSNNEKKPIVFIAGGEDGMDWLSSSVTLNFLNALLDSNNDLKILSNSFSFYLLPILNPDGFVYSKDKDRFWSKNRRALYTHTHSEEKYIPIGVNIARNWFFQRSGRIADEECNSVYIGQKSLSEEETQSFAYVLKNLATDTIAFINIRGFGRFITIPFAQPSDETNNHDIVMEILRATSSKVQKRHNATFQLGTTSRFFCNIADWIKKKLNIPLVFTLYLEDIETVLPQPRSINSIVEQFFTIVNESLLVTNEIYGPLFNSQTEISTSIPILVTILIFEYLYNISIFICKTCI